MSTIAAHIERAKQSEYFSGARLPEELADSFPPARRIAGNWGAAGRRRAHLPRRLRRLVGDAADREVRARRVHGDADRGAAQLRLHLAQAGRPAQGRARGARVVLGRDRGHGRGVALRERAGRDDARHRQGRRLGDPARGGPRDRVRLRRDLRGADRGAAAARCRHERGHGGLPGRGARRRRRGGARRRARGPQGRRRVGRGAGARVALQPAPLRARRRARSPRSPTRSRSRS